MIYHHSYVLSHEWGKGNEELFHSLAAGSGITYLATHYMTKDFKFKQDGFDRFGQPKFRIDLVVFDRDKWIEFLRKMRNIIDDERTFEDFKELINQLENER